MQQKDNNQNVFEKAAKVLYGPQTQKDKEEENLRNSLLKELGDKAQPKHVLYSSVDDLMKMKNEEEAKNLINSADKLNIQDKEIQVPLPEVRKNKDKEIQAPLPGVRENIDESFDNYEPKILDKIPVSTKSNNDTIQKYGSYLGKEEYEMPPLKAHISYSEDENKNEVKVSNAKQDNTSSKISDKQFEKIMKYVYNAEGGFVDNPNDRGGRTNMGVTQRTYDAYNKKHGLEQKDVKNITKEEADKIYYDEYWVASGADKIKDKYLAYMHYDAAINHGVGTAKRMLKQSGGDFDKYYQGRKNAYGDLAKRRQNQRGFYKGWINRIDKIDKMRKENALED